MTEILKPDNIEQIVDAVQWALSENVHLEIQGSGSKRALGRPVECEKIVSLSSLSGITMYEPDELVMSARAGTPMSEIEATLAENNQMLAFEPPNLTALLSGQDDATGTIGGTIACNLSGPRRIKAGAARDHFLGFTAVSGRGEIFKAGGRVVKNVTGFDLPKLLAGSYGTLSIMSDVIFKVLPVPEKTRTVLIAGANGEQAITAMSMAMNSAHEVSSATHLSSVFTKRSAVSYVSQAHTSITAVRVEGPGPSVEHRCKALRGMLSEFGETDELHSANSVKFWREIRDVHYFSHNQQRQLWRLSVPPSEGAATGNGLLNKIGGKAFLDWGGGLIWLEIDPQDDAAQEIVHAAAKAHYGHATLVRGSADVRQKVDVFHPQSSGLAAITRKIKDGFDPQNILNPGRMYEGA